MPRKEPKSFQAPLVTEELGEPVEVLLTDLTPASDLDADVPDWNFIQDIASAWIREPILICPDERFNKELFYPYGGKRRVLAVYQLHKMGYEYNGVPVAEMPIRAVLRRDLSYATSKKIAFKVNKLRSSNPITDVEAVRDAADRLGVSVFTKEGRRAIAQDLSTTANVVAKLSKGILLDEIVFDAFRSGQIAQETLTAILNLKDDDARQKIAQELRLGKELTRKDVDVYRQATVQTTLNDAVASRPNMDFSSPEDGGLYEVLELLKQGFDNQDWSLIRTAITNLEEYL